MNYTYLDSHPFQSLLPSGPFIVMTTNSASKKTRNLYLNKKVSLLVHDWVSVRPPTANPRASPPTFPSMPAGAPSALAALLMDMNSAEMGKISATMTGTAEILDQGSEVELWCKKQHLEYNGRTEPTKPTNGPAAATNGDDSSLTQLSGSPNTKFNDLKETVIAQEDDVRVVIVRIQGGSIADWKGGVREFILTSSDV